MIAVGCTGGIGSGKSTVAALLHERGAVVLDTDAFARDALSLHGAAYAATLARFGPGIGNPGGEIDRAALAAIVFSDPGARRDLEAIVHPVVEARVLEQLDRERLPGRVVVVDIPLLVETDARRRYDFDGVLVVDAPVDLAVARLIATRRMDEASARARVAAQIDRATRLRAADFIVMNYGTLAELVQMTERAWGWIERLGEERGELIESSR